MVLGIVVSGWFHHAFGDPRRYTGRAMLILAVTCLVNAHVAVLYYGTFTVTPLIVVIGIHFVARTELGRPRWRDHSMPSAGYSGTPLPQKLGIQEARAWTLALTRDAMLAVRGAHRAVGKRHRALGMSG